MEEKEEDREEKGMKEMENEISGDWTGEAGGTVVNKHVELQRGTYIYLNCWLSAQSAAQAIVEYRLYLIKY